MAEELKVAKDELAKIMKGGDKSQQAKQLLSTAYICDDTTEKVIFIKQAVSIFQEIGDKKGGTEASLALSRAEMASGNLDAAMAAAQESASIAISAEDKKGQAEALLFTAGIHAARDDLKESLKSTDAARVIYRELGDTKGQVAVLRSACMAQLSSGKPEQAMQTGYEALTLCRKVGDKFEEATTSMLAANAHLESLKKDQAELDPESEDIMADQAALAEGFQECVRVASDGVSLFEELGDKLETANALRMLSKVHMGAGEADASVMAEMEALGILKDVGDAAKYFDTLIALIQSNIANQCPAPAMRCCNEAKELCMQFGDYDALRTVEEYIQLVKEWIYERQSIKESRKSLRLPMVLAQIPVS